MVLGADDAGGDADTEEEHPQVCNDFIAELLIEYEHHLYKMFPTNHKVHREA